MDGNDTRNETRTWIGRAMPRREDPALLQGRGRFVDDIMPAGCVFIEFLRSTVPAGTISSLDVADARDMPGVLAVYTADDLGETGPSAVNRLIPDAPVRAFDILARGGVSSVGQPVAAIVAETRDAARDAAEAIWLDIEEAETAQTPQTIARWEGGEQQTETAFEVAAHVDHARVAPFALEPRACLAEPVGHGLRVWMSTQTPFRGRDDLARILGVDADLIQVIAPDVGGAFGGKASIFPEDVMTAFAARALGRPVKWTATRSDEFMAATQGRGAASSGVLGCDETGRFTRLAGQFRFDLGSWTPYSAYAPARNAGRILPGPYDVPAVTADLDVCFSATAPMNIYRGAGRPEAAMLIERLVDKAANAAGLDPLDIRRRNLRDGRTPGTAVTGEWIDTGDYAALLDALENRADYARKRAVQAERRAAGEVVGIGIALYIEPCGQGWETAQITLRPDGAFAAQTGSSAQGQGRQTAWAQIVADALGVRPDRITIGEGDTADLPNGIGALASRSTAIGGSAMMRAAEKLRRQIATALGVDHLESDHTGVWLDGAHLRWDEVANRLPAETRVVVETFTAPHEAWASGAALAQVAIDPDTGRTTVEEITWIDDAGRVVNQMLVEGQLLGGLAQGLGCVLSERVAYDPDGQLLTGSLMDYAVPRAKDMPRAILLDKLPTPSAANPLGAKGVGEAGCIAVPPAVLNALQDAILPFTDQDLPLPATPEILWRAINSPKEAT